MILLGFARIHSSKGSMTMRKNIIFLWALFFFVACFPDAGFCQNKENLSITPIYYEEKGAKLFDVEVLTLKGKKVNIITQGNQYIYTYKIKPAYTLNNVQFGFLLKTKNGNPLGGGAFPTKNKYISQISDLTQVKFFFRCTLNNGEYFLNCGTIAEINGKKDYVHRILDAYMIKVINANDQITSNIDFIDKIEVKEKNKK